MDRELEMVLEKLETAPDLDEPFTETQKRIDNITFPSNFDIVYDFAKRFINLYGIGPQFIEKVYLLGYIQRDKKDSKQHIKL